MPTTALYADSAVRKPLSYLAAIALSVVASWIAFQLYRVLADPLRSVPGPLLARFTRLWEVWALKQGNFEKTNVELHKKYGPIVRLAPGRYSINDKSAIKPIYGHGTKFTKSRFYDGFGSPHARVTNLLTTLDSQPHAAARRKIASLYSMSNMVSYEPYVDECSKLLCSKLEMFAHNKQPIDLPTWMQYYAFDVIGEITVGKPFGMMERGYDSMGVLKAIDGVTVHAAYFGLLPELHLWMTNLAEKFDITNPIKSVFRFVEERIVDRKVGNVVSDREDFLAKCIKLKEDGAIDEADQMGVIANNIVAGSDTTAITLSSIIYYLLQHPLCAQKLRQEIDSFEERGRLSDPVTFKEAQEMPYLQAVIKEGLRIHPATGQVLARIVPTGGSELCGRYFPAGTCVGANSWTIHYNPQIYGSDAHQFRPERWLGPKEEVAAYNEALFSFGQGSRTCLGKNVSLLEISKLIPQIFRKFDVAHVDPTAPKEWETNHFWFVKQKFECRFTPRVMA